MRANDDLNVNNPIFKPLQDELNKQLDKIYDNIADTLHQKKKEKKDMDEDRETVGYRLYHLQQQFKHLIYNMERAKERYEREKKRCDAKEIKLIAVKRLYDQSEEIYKQRESELHRLRIDLNQIDNELSDIEEIHQKKISDLVLAQRIAFKAEQEVQEKELDKQDQDMFINKLSERADYMRNQVKSLLEKIMAQREQNKQAKIALLQSKLEDEQIEFERNQLLQDWNSALTSVKFHLMELEELNQEMEEIDMIMLELGNEYNQIRQKIRDEINGRERSENVLARIQRRNEQIDSKISEIFEARKRKEIEQQKINQLIQQRENELNQLTTQRNELKFKYERSERSINELSLRIKEIHEHIQTDKEKQAQHNRNVLEAQRVVIPIRRQFDEKNEELSELKNQKAKMNMELVNLQHRIIQAEEGLKDLLRKAEADVQIIENYKSQIEGNNNVMQQNQKRLDILNKQVANKGSARPSNPLEIKAKDYQQKIQESIKRAQQIHQEWGKLQEILIQINEDCEIIDSSNTEVKQQVGSASRKRDRAILQLNSIQHDNQKLSIQMKVLKREIERLSGELNEQNVNIDNVILERLKSKEEEAMSIARKIEETVQEKSEIVEEKYEKEKAFAMLEKKKKMFEEKDASFDSKGCENDITMMKKRVNKMEEQLINIKRQQSQLAKNIEDATIQSESTDSGMTKEEKEKEIDRIKSEIEQTSRLVEEMKNDFQEKNEELNMIQRTVGQFSDQKESIENIIAEQKQVTAQLHLKLSKLKTMTKYFRQPSSNLSDRMVKQNYEQTKSQVHELCSLVERLSHDYPQYSHQLNHIVMKLPI